MLTVDEALDAILNGAAALEAEDVPLTECCGRILARDAAARLTQSPFAASAMDGYAVRFSDMKPGAQLKVVGEAPAGAPFKGAVGEGEAVRIFTGAPVPAGADHVLIQEDTARDGDVITVSAAQPAPRNIRAAGADFREGDVLAKAGTRLHEFHGAVFAAANLDSAPVRRRPKIAIFSNGDELVDPGAALRPGQIVNSNHYALREMARAWGGAPDYLGCAPDRPEAVEGFFERAREADVILPVGGASVGDHDYVKSAFAAAGGETVFAKVAMRPGKPTWFGRIGRARVVGLPGNPASAIVAAALFAQPLARRLAGEDWRAPFLEARLAAPAPANGWRESYLRATASPSGEGFVIEPAPNQDSALLSPFAAANALIRRPPDAPEAAAGDVVQFVPLR